MSEKANARRLRRHLHFDALAPRIRGLFESIPDSRRCPTFSLADTLMAGLAMFSLKDPSMLAFQRRALDHNLRSVFGLLAIPSDTQMRQILDEVDPQRLRRVYNDLFYRLQRDKVLQDFEFLDGHYLIALDGVEYFCSQKVHCQHCMTRQHRGGGVSYHHQMLAAAIVHPDHKEVIPLPPEPIHCQDGEQKNDCERNAARRWLRGFRKDHPHLKVILIEDGLSSNAPHIRDLQEADVRYLLGVKPGDHAYLFAGVVDRIETGEVTFDFEETDAETGITRGYLYIEDLPLNESNPDVRVDYFGYAEISKEGQAQVFSWVTDLELRQDKARVRLVPRGGRARWKIENETFNTLKNQGYNFEHNYGHGEKNLAVVLALLMMLAFLIDQIQQKCNPLFRAAWEKKGPKCALWEAIRHLFYSFEVSSMREIYQAIAQGYPRPALGALLQAEAAAVPDTS
jgi:DDE family transposase